MGEKVKQKRANYVLEVWERSKQTKWDQQRQRQKHAYNFRRKKENFEVLFSSMICTFCSNTRIHTQQTYILRDTDRHRHWHWQTETTHTHTHACKRKGWKVFFFSFGILREKSELKLKTTSIRVQCSPRDYNTKHGNCVFIKTR